MDNLSIFCIVLMIGWLATAIILVVTLGYLSLKDDLLKTRMDAIVDLKKVIAEYKAKELALSDKHSNTARNQTRDAKGRFVSSSTKDKIDPYKSYKESIMSNGRYLTKDEIEEIRNSEHADPYDESTSGLYATLSEPSDHINPDLTPNVEEFYDIHILDKDDDFILPEKWAVRITKENREVLMAWAVSQPDFNIKYDSNFTEGNFVVTKYPDRSYQYWGIMLPTCITEITFEQFKKYVLNK